MLTVVLPVAFALVVAALLLNLWRLLRGPSALDRVLALDTLYVNAVAVIVLLGIARGTALYFEAALLIAMLGFVTTVVLSKYITRGDGNTSRRRPAGDHSGLAHRPAGPGGVLRARGLGGMLLRLEHVGV